MPPPPPEGTQWPGLGSFSGRKSFRQLLSEAIAELSLTGYVSEDRVAYWIDTLRRAADAELGSERAVDTETRERLNAVFERLIDRGKIGTYVPGVSRLDISMIRPNLRAELDRRIVASADLIKLHRREAVERTLQRFQGWSTAIPPGGDGTIDKRETRASIGKSVAQFRFEKRRVDIDQSHKLIANISDIVATDQGAIAGIWHDHGEHDRSYDARKQHMGRAGKVYAVRDSWAIRQGLMTKGAGYMDEMTKPGQEISCGCWYEWIMSPRRLPDSMLTRKGQEWIEAGRMRMAA